MSTCPPYAPFFGFAGVASAVSWLPNIPYSSCRSTALFRRWCSAVSLTSTLPHFSFGVDDSTLGEPLAVGAAFGTTKAGIGISGLGTFKPELIMKVGEAGTAELTGTD